MINHSDVALEAVAYHPAVPPALTDLSDNRKDGIDDGRREGSDRSHKPIYVLEIPKQLLQEI